ncbi:MAG: hypothetical protein M0036_16110 [Desulfobacteraceae bacterium]|nr:hypothetical protein [Desulfobacteraceae bacterium]
MNVKPVLGDWEIPHIEAIQSLENRSFVELQIPGRAGSLFQDMNAAPIHIGIWGSLFGDEARNEFLETLREKFNAGEPVTFVADITTATEVQYVVIQTMEMTQNAAHPDQMDYSFVLKESPPPPPPPAGLADIDAGLLDEAGGLLDSVTGALGIIDTLGSIPNFGDPTTPLQESLNQVSGATEGVSGVIDGLRTLFL